MKKVSLVVMLVLAGLLVLTVAASMAQLTPGPPPPPVSSPEVGRYVATPIGGGIVVLLSMLGYGAYKLRKNDNE